MSSSRTLGLAREETRRLLRPTRDRLRASGRQPVGQSFFALVTLSLGRLRVLANMTAFPQTPIIGHRGKLY